jgi:hypothetical protein
MNCRKGTGRYDLRHLSSCLIPYPWQAILLNLYRGIFGEKEKRYAYYEATLQGNNQAGKVEAGYVRLVPSLPQAV